MLPAATSSVCLQTMRYMACSDVRMGGETVVSCWFLPCWVLFDSLHLLCTASNKGAQLADHASCYALTASSKKQKIFVKIFFHMI